MKTWLRRVFYMLLLIIWLIVMVFPVTAFLLATRDQIQIGASERQHTRIFMVQDQGINGLGLERTRRKGNDTCSQTNINYFLWEGSAQSIVYCQCYDPLTDDPLPAEQTTCE